MDVSQLIAEFGFPVVATVGLLYVIYYIWSFITIRIKAKLGETSTVLIALIDRIRMLDNDIIRLQQKLDTVIELRETENGEEKERKAEQGRTKKKKGRGE
tara:strand:- start:1692 stop:1991 length:300 start_codon:yes stop_codon:yes gene_type:complete